MSKRFDGKVVIVTGASSGIGRAAAVAFGAEGAKVVCASRREEENETTLEAVQAAGGDGLALCVDVTNPEQVDGMVRTAVETYGCIDVAFNNAGLAQDGVALGDASDVEFGKIFDVNVAGLFYCMRAEIKAMRAKGGAIINTSSVVAQAVIPNNAIYAGSKAAVVAMSRTAAAEEAGNGIRINVVSPGPVATPMLQGWMDERPGAEPQLVGAIPAGRIGEPGELANAVLWIASDEASFVYGANLAVSGGFGA